MKNQVLTVLLAIAILFCQTMVVFVPIFTFLDAINYDIPGLVWDNVKYFFSDKINYDEYRSSFFCASAPFLSNMQTSRSSLHLILCSSKAR